MRWIPVARWLHARLVVPSRPPDQLIGDADAPYMLRWRLWRRNPLLNGYLHHILRLDEEPALHDHPWVSVSMVLAGSVRETYSVSGRAGERVLTFGSLVVRTPRFAHRLAPEPGAGEDVWTLFLTGPKLREWGFHCADGWTHWKTFTAIDENGRRRGCG